MGMKIVAWLTDAGTPRARIDMDARWPGSRTEPSDALVTMDDAHARIDAAVAAERERCAAILKARADKIAAEADRAVKSEPDEVSALRAMAWQLTVAEREIRGA